MRCCLSLSWSSSDAFQCAFRPQTTEDSEVPRRGIVFEGKHYAILECPSFSARFRHRPTSLSIETLSAFTQFSKTSPRAPSLPERRLPRSPHVDLFGILFALSINSPIQVFDFLGSAGS